MNALDDLIKTLEAGPAESRAPDAIDAELSRRVRATSVSWVRESEVFQAYQQEVIDASVRADTVNKLLVLINTALRMVWGVA